MGGRARSSCTQHASERLRVPAASWRTMPDPLPKEHYLDRNRRVLPSAVLRGALGECRADLEIQHRVRLSTVPPHSFQRVSPIGPGLRRAQTAEGPLDDLPRAPRPQLREDADFAALVLERNGVERWSLKGPRSRGLPLPLRCTY